jgi:hypothetical protein
MRKSGKYISLFSFLFWGWFWVSWFAWGMSNMDGKNLTVGRMVAPVNLRPSSFVLDYGRKKNEKNRKFST